MEQLKRDRDYTSFLVRTIQRELNDNKFGTRDDLVSYINKIDNDLRSNEGINYITSNGLSFNYQVFQQQVGRILEEYDRMHQVASIYDNTVYQQNSGNVQQQSQVVVPTNDVSVQQPVAQVAVPTNDVSMQQPVQMAVPTNDVSVQQPVQVAVPTNDVSMQQPVQVTVPTNDVGMQQSVQMAVPTNDVSMQQPVQTVNNYPQPSVMIQQPINNNVGIQQPVVANNIPQSNVVNVADYQNMQTTSYQTQQDSYLPITKVDVNSVPSELIEKINFLIVNPGIDINDFVVDVKSGTFKNVKDNQIYDVRKNAVTNSFELVPKSMQLNNSVNTSNVSNEQSKSNQINLSMFSDKDLWDMVNNPNFGIIYREGAIAELKRRESEGNNENKTKKLIPDMNNSAFASTVLLTGLSAVSGIIIATILLAR